MGMLDGRVALVTGGSKGLGAATARLFAQAGARVVVTFGSDAQAADRLIASLPGTGHRASHTPAQDTRAIESLAAAIGTTEGRLDILVNNAGSTRVIRHADLRALDDAFFDFVLAVNLRGPSPWCAPPSRCSRRAGRASSSMSARSPACAAAAATSPMPPPRPGFTR